MGQIAGALVAMLLSTRLVLWLLKRTGDNVRRILLAHGAALIFAIVWMGYVDIRPDGSHPLSNEFAVYGLCTLPWLAMDFVGLRRRRAAAAISN